MIFQRYRGFNERSDTVFLDQITVPAERFSDLPINTAFVCEEGLLHRNGGVPRPCVWVKVAGDGYNCERALPADNVTAQDPETLYLQPDARVIIVH